MRYSIMNDNEYCRLCAELKSNNKLIDLQAEHGQCQEIVAKLTRFNVQINLHDDILPKAACFTCVNSLQRAFDFISAVEQAQSTINNLMEIKKEVYVSDDDDFTYEEPENCEIYDTDIESEVKIIKIVSINTGSTYQDSLEKQPEDSSKRTENGHVSDNEDFIYEEPANQNDNMEMECLEEIEYLESPSTSQNSLENETETKQINISKSPDAKPVGKMSENAEIMPLSYTKMSWKDFNWLCSYCETQFSTFDELHNHSMQYHKVCNPYRCTECNLRRSNLNRFIMHVRSQHKKYLKYFCYKCNYNFSTLKDWPIHMAKHRVSDLVCCGCNTSFKSQEELDQHTSTYYRNGMVKKRALPMEGDGLTCKICKKKSKSKYYLHSHMAIHTDRRKNHMCEMCGKCFYVKHEMMVHIRSYHLEEKPYKCDICKTAFKTVSGFKKHAGSHNSDKLFPCEDCGKSYRLQSYLAKHRSNVHTDPSHVCTICKKTFKTKAYLQRHLFQHNGQKPYSCTICRRDFTYWANYNLHMKSIHGTDMSKRKRTPYGTYPIDPLTGELICEDAHRLSELKKKMGSTNVKALQKKSKISKRKGKSKKKE